MTSPSRHPSPERWALWLRGELETSDAKALEAHRRRCRRCREEVAVLALLHQVRGKGPWAAPPRRVRDRVRRMPRVAQAPRRARRQQRLAWTVGDVRGTGLSATAQGHLLARSVPHAEVSVLARPPHGEGPWRMEGRVWLRQPADEPIVVVLAVGEHVLATTTLQDGGRFTLEEVVGRGWALEIHLPTGETLVLEDPAS